VALVGTTTFFAAKVFSDYHPNSKLRPYLWTAAALATGTTGYLRYRSGRHFPSDILVGAAVGTLSGILVPQFHKVKFIKNENVKFIAELLRNEFKQMFIRRVFACAAYYCKYFFPWIHFSMTKFPGCICFTHAVSRLGRVGFFRNFKHKPSKHSV